MEELKQYQYSYRAYQYADQILSGAIPACQQIKQACQRYLNQLNSDYWVYDPIKAEKACAFIELLPHTKGKWATPTLKLENWQIWIICNIFGFVDPHTGYRKHTEALLLIPRKNAKSTLAAGIANYMAFMDGEEGAEVLIGANSMDQADACFGPVKGMVQKTPALIEAAGIIVQAASLTQPGTGSIVKRIIGKPGDGSNPHCAILDEAHENDSSEQYDTMKTGMGARTQPLLLTITTAGFNVAGPLRQRQIDAEAVLAGNVNNDSLFAAIYTIDKDDDWRDFAVWKKANPNCGVSIHEKALQQQWEDALNKPADKPTLLTKHLNVWQNSATGWISQLDWMACASDKEINDFKGYEAYVAWDLSTRTDIAAVAALTYDDHGIPHFFPFLFLPEGAVNGSKNAAAYRSWIAGGHILTSTGNAIDFSAVKAKILDLFEHFNVRFCAYDQWQGEQLAQEIATEFPYVEVQKFVQNVGNFNPVMHEFEALVLDQRLRHSNNPCLNWMASNVSIKRNSRDHYFPNKPDGQHHLKIDGIVACLMALGLKMSVKPQDEVVLDFF